MKKRLLAGIVLTDADRKRLEPVMRNWLKAHAYLVKLPVSWEGYRELERMLGYEAEVAKRYDVARRIFGRMQAVRADLLQRELAECFT
jgi:hypothetical protein